MVADKRHVVAKRCAVINLVRSKQAICGLWTHFGTGKMSQWKLTSTQHYQPGEGGVWAERSRAPDLFVYSSMHFTLPHFALGRIKGPSLAVTTWPSMRARLLPTGAPWPQRVSRGCFIFFALHHTMTRPSFVISTWYSSSSTTKGKYVRKAKIGIYKKRTDLPSLRPGPSSTKKESKRPGRMR